MGVIGAYFDACATGAILNAASPTAEVQEPSFVDRAVNHVSKLGM